MNKLLVVEPSMLSELIKLQLQQMVDPEATTATAPSVSKQTRHQRYTSESYFGDDDMTDTTIATTLSWQWDSLGSMVSENVAEVHSNRVRTYAVDQGDIECILLATNVSADSVESTASCSFLVFDDDDQKWEDQKDSQEYNAKGPCSARFSYRSTAEAPSASG